LSLKPSTEEAHNGRDDHYGLAFHRGDYPICHLEKFRIISGLYDHPPAGRLLITIEAVRKHADM